MTMKKHDPNVMNITKDHDETLFVVELDERLEFGIPLLISGNPLQTSCNNFLGCGSPDTGCLNHVACQ